MKITIELPDAEVNDLINLCDSFTNLSEQLSSLLDGLERVPTCMEYQENMRPYIRMLSERVTSEYECLVRKDSLQLLPGMVFRNKKLLPYDGHRVKVLEYGNYVAVFSMEGKHIVDLYKYRPCDC